MDCYYAGMGNGRVTAVYVVGQFSGAYINPAVTVGLAAAGLFDWTLVLPYIGIQMLGAAFGAFLVWLSYKDHFTVTEDEGAKLAVHCTVPAKRKYSSNFMTEAIGTLMLVFSVLYLVSPGFLGSYGKFSGNY